MIIVMWSALSPQKLSFQLVSFDRNNDLPVVSLNSVTVGQDPPSLSSGFVVVKLALKVWSVGVGPLPTDKPVLDPTSDVFHACGIEDIGPLTVLFAIEPKSRVDIFVGIDKHALAFFLPLVPLSIVLTLITIDDPTDAVLEIILELSTVDIPIAICVLSFSASQLHYIISTPLAYSPS